MRLTPRRNFFLASVVILILACASAAAFLWATAPRGPGIDNDSAHYLSAADGLRHGEGWLGVDRRPYTLWPPLYPSLLALLELLGFGALEGARWLHAVCLALVTGLGAALVLRIARARWTAVLCALTLATAPALFTNAAMVWSESVFLALVLGALHAGLSFDRTRTRASFSALCVLSALALTQRYLGIALILTSSVVLMRDAHGASPRQRLGRTVLYEAISLTPTLVWFARNAVIAGNLDGRRGPAVGDLTQDLANCGRVLASWLTGFATSPIAAGIAFAAFVGLSVAVVRDRSQTRQRLTPLLFGAVYLGLAIALRRAIEFDHLDERLLIPLLPVALITLALGLDALTRTSLSSARGILLAAVALLGCAYLYGNSRELLRRMRVARTEGAGVYDKAVWRDSPTSQWLRGNLGAANWLSNDPFAFFFATNERATPLPPRPAGYAKLHERLPSELHEFSIAWYVPNVRAIFPRDVVAEHYDVELLHEFADGQIYALRLR